MCRFRRNLDREGNMKRRWASAVAAATAAVVLGAPPGALAAPAPPGAQMSSNLEYVTRVADTAAVVEGKFDEVRGKDILVLTGRFGFKTLDVSDPTNPKPLDTFMPGDIAGPGEQPGIPFGGYWQNEDMNIDTRRKLIIGALDPRHTDKPLGACPVNGSVLLPECKSGFYVISYKDPANLRQIGDFVELPSGHTSTCIDGCRYIWTGGPARRSDQGWLGPILTSPRPIGNGRPIWVTDLTDPWNPKVSDQPIDLWRNDQYTDYSHDVNVDEEGIAWVSGRGGIRGYATKGRWRDPYQNRVRQASPFDPILVAGGGVAGTTQQVMLMHNSWRPTDGSVRAAGVPKGDVLIGTEEDFTEPCEQSGRVVFSQLTDSWGGEPASQSTLTKPKPYRMKALSTFHPFQDGEEGTEPGPSGSVGCSAHYFELEDSTLGVAWYRQGLRLVDVHDATDPRQVGYYRVTAPAGQEQTNPTSNSWDLAWKRSRKGGDLIYLFDMNRGVEVLRLRKGAQSSAKMRTVRAPKVTSNRGAAVVVGGLDTNTTGGLVCPLFEIPS
jgi:hypothetical protein